MQKMQLEDTLYSIDEINPDKNILKISRFNEDTKMNITFECIEDSNTDDKWDRFWDLFTQNEARKINIHNQKK